MTKRFFFALTLFAFVLALGACSDDGSKEVIGAWKSTENGLAGKPYTILIDEKTFAYDMKAPEEVAFAKKDGKILIFTKRISTERPTEIVTIIDKDTASFKNGWETRTYVRTTPEEVKRIADMPRQYGLPPE